MNAETPRPPKDLPSLVVQQAQDLGRKLDRLIEQRTGHTMPPPSLAAAAPKNG